MLKCDLLHIFFLATQASEGKSTVSQEVHINERKPCQQTNHNTEHSRSTPKPAGQVCNDMFQDAGGISASQTSTSQLSSTSSSGTQRRCSPEEIQRKKADAIRRRKIRLGLSGMKHWCYWSFTCEFFCWWNEISLNVMHVQQWRNRHSGNILKLYRKIHVVPYNDVYCTRWMVI